MDVSRLIKRHKNAHNTDNQDLKPTTKLLDLNAAHWLVLAALSISLLAGVALAGDTAIFSGGDGSENLLTDSSDSTHGRFRAESAGELTFGQTTENRRDDQAAQSNGEGPAAGSTETIIETENGDEITRTTTVNQDGSVEHSFESDDGQTIVNIKVNSGSESSGQVDVDSKTKIDIDTDFHSSIHIDGQNQTDDGRNNRYNR